MSQAHNRTTSYHWYLGSAFWRERREFILARANHICENCNDRPVTGGPRAKPRWRRSRRVAERNDFRRLVVQEGLTGGHYRRRRRRR
jgi:hypothetical protein